jgi:hypothetical protein
MKGIEFLKLINKKYNLNNEIKKEKDFLKDDFAKGIMKVILKNIDRVDYDNTDMLQILSLFMDVLNGDIEDEIDTEDDDE